MVTCMDMVSSPSLVRGSSSAVARSAIRIATSTATVMSRNRRLHQRVVLALDTACSSMNPTPG